MDGAGWMKSNEGPLPWLRKTVTLERAPTTAMAYVCRLGLLRTLRERPEGGGRRAQSGGVELRQARAVPDPRHRQASRQGEELYRPVAGPGLVPRRVKNAGVVGPMVKAAEPHVRRGRPRTIVTDATWKARPSHVTPLGKGTSGSYGGEQVEAEKEITNWNAADYDDSAWQAATVHHPPTPVIAAQMMEPNRVLDEVRLAAVQSLKDGFVLDMGRNYTGWFELTLPDDVKRGTTISMEFADKRFPDGKFQVYGQRSVYVARAAAVSGSATALATRRSAMRSSTACRAPAGGGPRLARHDRLRARLHLLLRSSVAQPDPRHDVLDLQVPQSGRLYRRLPAPRAAGLRRRLGDLDGNGDAELPHRAVLRQVGGGLAQRPERTGRCALHRAYSQDAGGGPVWSGFCITMPWQVYLTYGDRRPLEQGWPVMKKWLAFIDTKMGDGLLQRYVGIGCAGSPEWNFLGDWVPPGRKQGKDRVDDRSTLFFNNCYLVYCLQLAGKIGRVVGDNAQAEIYEKRAKEIARQLHTRFLNPDGATYANGEQTYLVLPLLFGITPQERRPQGHGRAGTRHHGHAKRPPEHGHARQLLHDQVPHRPASDNDLLALMHTKEDFPSFGNMIRSGATTIWEEWDGDNSQIHNTMISVGLWFIEGLAGIRYDEKAPGFQHFIAAPGVESGLKRFDASLTTGYGRITSAWRVDGNTLTWDLTVPANTTATVVLPATGLGTVRESGLSVESQPGIAHPAIVAGVLHCDVTLGTYRFTSQLPRK